MTLTMCLSASTRADITVEKLIKDNLISKFIIQVISRHFKQTSIVIFVLPLVGTIKVDNWLMDQ